MNTLILLAAAAGSPALEPVVVTATRTENPASEVLASVELIARRRTAAAAGGGSRRCAALVPGVEVARLGGPGQQTSVFVRGTESNHVLVLMDGLRINPGTIGSAAIQNIAPELVERVEVVKGPRSTLYGSDAIGGVINVITQRGAANGGSVQAGYGRFETRTASFAQASATRGARCLDRRVLDRQRRDSRRATATRSTAATRTLSFTARRARAVGAVELGPARLACRGHVRVLAIFSCTPVDQDFENPRSPLTADFSPTQSWDSAPDGRARRSTTWTQNQSPDFVDTETRTRVDWQNDFALSERNTLTAGLLWQDEEADAESFGPPYGADTTTSQFYVQDQATFGRTACCSARRIHGSRDLRRPRDLERGVRLRLR